VTCYKPETDHLPRSHDGSVANDAPPAIRGILKRWFVEPKPNVFVGTVNRRTRDKVLDYVKRNAKA
jgi:CRISPR-associated protein Cas2